MGFGGGDTNQARYVHNNPGTFLDPVGQSDLWIMEPFKTAENIMEAANQWLMGRPIGPASRTLLNPG